MRTLRERQLDWIARLRSGRYKQGIGYLREKGKFCCLGVGCDVLADEGLGEWSKGDIDAFVYSGSGDASMERLPSGVPELFDLSDQEGELPFRDRCGQRVYLTFMNDVYDCTFDQIADVIEYFFLERES